MDDTGISGIVIGVLVTILLVAVNALLASAELALVGLSEHRLLARAEAGDKKAHILHRMKQNPGGFLSTIQIGITLAGLLSGAFAADSFAQPIVAWVATLGVTGGLLSFLDASIVVVITLILTYFMLIFGELVPKRLAMVQPEKTANASVGLIHILSRVTGPLVKLLTISTNGVLRLLGVDPELAGEAVSEEDILHMVKEGNEQGLLLDEEVELVRNVFTASDLVAEDVMTHRTEIAAIPAGSEPRALIELMAKVRFSRYPVYEGSIDHIVGIVYAKDLWSIYLAREEEKPLPSLQELTRPAYYVPEDKPLVELFSDMKMSGNHIAVVVDEYGGTSGILTVMDIVQEIVGDFDDEDEMELLTMDGDGVYHLDGSMEMEDVLELLGPLPDAEPRDILSGYLIDQLGYIPAADSRASLTLGEFRFAVEKVDGAMIRTVSAVKILK